MKKILLVSAVLAALSSHAVAKQKNTLPLDEIRNFVDVYNTIKREYVEEKDGKTLIDFAIEGLLDGLDPHSVYLKKAELEEFSDSASGSYLGFGVQLEMRNDRLVVVAPIPDSPADEAGLLPNDIIAEIDGVIIENLSMAEASRLLKDKTEVVLTIARSGEKPFEVTLKKTDVVLPSVKSKLLDGDYGYIRIAQFQDNTAEQFDKALEKQLDKEVKGIVIDLRNNPGGLLHAATAVADNFLDAGLIVSMKNKNTGEEEKIHAKKETRAPQLPLVVLINEGSASAAELLAGALQSHQRAVVVGRPSFGKGSVQNIVPLSNGDAIKLTTARYYTPDGKSIQAKGIVPDIALSQLKVDDKEVNLLSYSEADISGHLEQSTNDKKTKKKNNDKQSSKSPSKDSELAKNDLQLFEALNVLKVLNLKR